MDDDRVALFPTSPPCGNQWNHFTCGGKARDGWRPYGETVGGVDSAVIAFGRLLAGPTFDLAPAKIIRFEDECDA